mgnify:CR=1 FL=1
MSDTFAKRGGRPRVVAAKLREAILNGDPKPNQKLPPEPVLATQLGVSRATLRQAISQLEAAGLLFRRRGDGTYVSRLPHKALMTNLSELRGTAEIIASQGHEPTVVDVTFAVELIEGHIAALFGDSDSQPSPFLHVSRTWLADGTPVIQCEEFLPFAIVGHGEELRSDAQEKSRWSLYASLRKLGWPASWSLCRVLATNADGRLSAVLQVPEGHALLTLHQLHYTDRGLPVLYSENTHRCDMIDVQVVRSVPWL